MDPIILKKLFPIFDYHEKEGKPLIYLDNGATYQKPFPVIQALHDFYTTSYASVGRGVYPLAESATARFQEVRNKVARFINAEYSDEIIFVRGTTEGINLIATAWAKHNLKAGDEILLTQAEHHANLLPWQDVVKQTGAILTFIPLNRETYLLEDGASYITNRTKLVAVTHVSNVLGNVWGAGNNLENLINRAHAVGARVLLDGAQAISHKPLDVRRLGADFYLFSGHKTVAPPGIGVLYIKKELHDATQPYQFGGGMLYSATYEDAVWNQAPNKFETGTPALGDVIGLGAALDFLQEKVDYTALQEHETQLCNAMLEGLALFEGITVVGSVEMIRKHSFLICFTAHDVHPHDLAAYLGFAGVAVRAGHHCAQPLVNLLGFDAFLRVSFGMYNTLDDVAVCLKVLEEGLSFFRTLKK
jgi:cysteine desulfurase/selenocysteine lyase